MNNIAVTNSFNGSLDFKTVPTLSKMKSSLIISNQQAVFDLSGVSYSDNAGLGLLIYLASLAKAHKKELKFINVPKHLLELMDSVQVRELLPIV
jgi:Predicted NTP binding protein (contains STAS domain)